MAHGGNWALGPSPRVRGSLARRVGHPLSVGSIPACAGKPASRCRGARLPGVHPRVCGEAVALDVLPPLGQGPSPRVRGSRRHPVQFVRGIGSIPACAGKPTRGEPERYVNRVHPRVCGEANTSRWRSSSMRGPSPRVRGSLTWTRTVTAAVGSIPACAGKPYTIAPHKAKDLVHPRVCGEAACNVDDQHVATGPSPRVRGSLHAGLREEKDDGSIPACAGKPRRRPSGTAG